MIKQMKRRFLIVAMSSFSAVMLILFSVLITINYYQTVTRLDDQASDFITWTLQTTSPDQSPASTPMTEPQDNQGPRIVNNSFDFWGVFDLNSDNPEKTRRFFDYFYVLYDSKGDVSQTVLNAYDTISEDQAQEAADEIMAARKSAGWSGAYRYVKVPLETGQTAVFYYDAMRDIDAIVQLGVLAVIIFIVILILAFIVLWAFSATAIQPIVNNIERQKEFISNASHEIKTPLAILSTNNDVIEMLGQKNEWTQSNRKQIHRLNDLIEQMLLLARFDEGKINLDMSAVDLTDLVKTLIEDVEILATEGGKSIDVSMDQTVIVNSHQQTLRQLLNALLENAIKYQVGNQPIEVKWDDSINQLWIMNECEPMTLEESKRLFDRFYRRDTARNREQGGSGMGLSIAYSLAQAAGIGLDTELVRPDKIAFVLTFGK